MSSSNQDHLNKLHERHLAWDKKLVARLREKRRPRFKQLKHSWQIFSGWEKKIMGLAFFLIIASSTLAIWQNYDKLFVQLPDIGGVHTEALIGQPRYINPLYASQSDVDRDLTQLVFAGLMKRDKNLQLVTDLAESYEISDDEKTYTFKLRPNLRWSDEKPLTSEDIVFTFARLQEVETKSPLEISFRGIIIAKIDEQTVSFTLPEPFAPFLSLLTVGILPKHRWESVTAKNTRLALLNLRPLGAGPWQMDTFTKDANGNILSYALVPNPQYHGQTPFLGKLEFHFYPTIDDAVRGVKRKETKALSYLPKEFENVFADRKQLKHYSLSIPQYTALFFNQDEQPALKNSLVREALAVSLDKNVILKEILGGQGSIVEGPILPGFLGYTDEVHKYPFDLVKASELLEKAGWQAIDSDSYLAWKQKQLEATKAQSPDEDEESETTETEKNDQQPADEEHLEVDLESLVSEPLLPYYRQYKNEILELTITTVNQPVTIKTAEVIKKFWEAIGIKVNLKLIEGSVIRRETIKPRDYELLLFRILVGGDPDPYPFWHSSQNRYPGVNLAIFSNAKADNLLEKARQTSNLEIRQENYKKFQQIISEELPAIFFYRPTYTYVVHEDIKGIETKQIILPADRFISLSDWYKQTKIRPRYWPWLNETN